MDQTLQENETLLNVIHTELHAEHKHLTTKAVAIEHSIPRSIAASLLEAVPYFNQSDDSEYTYEITRCVFDRVGDKHGKSVVQIRHVFLPHSTFNMHAFIHTISLTTQSAVAKLKTSDEIFSKGNQQTTHKNKIHSIALKIPNGVSSILAAHMQTMSLLNDHQDTMLDPVLACDAIAPALEVEMADKDILRNRRVQNQGSGDGAKPNGAGNRKSSLSKSIVKNAAKNPPSHTVAATKKKPTSAASFFKSEPSTKKVKTEKTASKSTSKKPSKEKEPVKKVKKEKVAEQKKGNADDFVGDEDEDEDFAREDQARKERNAIEEEKKNKQRQIKEEKLKQQVTRKPMPRDDGNGEEDRMDIDDNNNDDDTKDAVHVHGAMDAFATKKVKKDVDPEPKGRKRRKQVLEEKTFVDENGFFRTETVTVWKEIEDGDDEEEEGQTTASICSKIPATKAKPKHKKSMKQQGLMGFFAKKS